MTEAQRARRGLSLIVVVGGLLVASHRGEFWPFSIYPMFSQAGRSWHRSIVRADVPHDARWQARTLDDLPGRPFALETHGIPQIDFSEYVDHTRSWDGERIEGLRAMFGSSLRAPLTIYEVHAGEHGVGSSPAEPILQLSAGASELP